jgi:hypothetical protein
LNLTYGDFARAFAVKCVEILLQQILFMKKDALTILAIAAAVICVGFSLNAQTNSQPSPLVAGEAIELPGTSGGFDFIRFDAQENRLLLGHARNKSFDVVDLKSKKC